MGTRMRRRRQQRVRMLLVLITSVIIASSSMTTRVAGADGVMHQAADQASTVYALSGTSLYVREPDAAAWAERPSGAPTTTRSENRNVVRLNDLLVHPADPQFLYVVAAERGIYHSPDGGASWQLAAWTAISGAYPNSFAHLVPVPGDARGVFVSTTYGWFRTDDAGLSWQPVDPWGQPGGASVPRSIATDPFGRTALYRSTPTTIERSDDGGMAWHDVAEGVGMTGIVAVAPTDPPTMYARFRDGIMRRQEGSSDWLSLGPFPTVPDAAAGSMRELLVDAAVSTTLYALVSYQPHPLPSDTPYRSGIVRSVDGGATWRLLPTGLRDNPESEVAVGGGAEPRLYLAPHSTQQREYNYNQDHVYATGVDDPDWHLVQSSEQVTPVLGESAGVLDLAVDPIVPDTVYVARTGGLFRSRDRGGAWDAILTFPEVPVATRFDASPDGQTLYTTAPWGPTTLLSRSIDGGWTWTAGAPVPGTMGSLGVDPFERATVYAGSGECVGCRINEIDTTLIPAIHRSRDGGATWATTTLGDETLVGTSVMALTFDPVRRGVLYAGLGTPARMPQRGGVVRSEDDGDTWLRLEGLPDCAVHSIAVAPSNRSMLYVATACGMVTSRDGGATWQAAQSGLPRFNGADCACPASEVDASYQTVVVSPSDPNVAYLAMGMDLYRAGSVGGIYRTTDGGVTWTAAMDGLPTIRTIRPPSGSAASPWSMPSVMAFAIDPASPTTLYAAVSDYMCLGYNCSTSLVDVYRSTDGGQSWSSAGLPQFVRHLLSTLR